MTHSLTVIRLESFDNKRQKDVRDDKMTHKHLFFFVIGKYLLMVDLNERSENHSRVFGGGFGAKGVEGGFTPTSIY